MFITSYLQECSIAGGIFLDNPGSLSQFMERKRVCLPGIPGKCIGWTKDSITSSNGLEKPVHLWMPAGGIGTFWNG